MMLPGIDSANGSQNSFWIAVQRLFEYSSQRSSGVLRIEIDPPLHQCLVRDIAAREIETAIDTLVCGAFDLLCQQLAEDDLLGKVLAANHDTRCPWRRTGHK